MGVVGVIGTAIVTFAWTWRAAAAAQPGRTRSGDFFTIYITIDHPEKVG
jgi:hypothetical protein